MFDFMDDDFMDGDIMGAAGLQGIEVDLVPLDFNYDGIIDAWGYDSTGSGTLDMFGFDTDGDGLIDTTQIVVPVDTTGDGVDDILSIHTDFDMDGNIDMKQLFADTDGDGGFDTYTEVYSVDVDGDGIADYYEVLVDENMDGIFDVSAVVDSNYELIFIDQIETMQSEIDYVQLAFDLENVETFDPNNYDPNSIIGDPAHAMEAFYPQDANYSCAVVSQGFVIQQLTGQELSEDYLSGMAYANQWYAPGGGTYDHNIGNILLEHGLTVSRTYDNSLDDIANILDNGGGVIVTVDSLALHSSTHDAPFAPGIDTSDHAIQVIGIDNSDPDNIMVIVNDPGIQNGGGAMIHIDTFMNAWDAGNNFIVSAYA